MTATLDNPREPAERQPSGWADASITDLAELTRGVSYAKGEANTSPGGGRVALLRANNIGDGLNFSDLQYVPQSRVSDEQRLRPGDVILAMSSGSKSVVGKAASVREAWDGTFGAFCGVLRPNREIDAAYFGLFFQTKEYRNAISEASAGTNINNLKREYFEALRVPIPPLAEQKRIVAKVEELLARVNAARARLAKTPTILKRFRQSVLAAACSGQLTADWRDRHPSSESAAVLLERLEIERRKQWIGRNRNRKYCPPEAVESEELPELPGQWVWTNFDHCAWEITVGHVGPMKERYVELGVPFLRSQNVRPLRFDPKGLVFVNSDFHSQLRKSALNGGEILITRSGANTGDCCVFPIDVGDANCSDLVITRPLSGLLPAYGAMYVASPEGQTRIGQRETGMAQPHFNIGAMRVKAFPLPPLAEQHEIIRRVEALFALADKIEARLQVATARVEKITQSILAKAFRGELVPTEAQLAREQNRPYEPASVLLERIRQSRHGQAAIAQQRRTPRKQITSPVIKAAKRKLPRVMWLRRGAIASYLVEHLHVSPDFGRTELEKGLYLAEAYVGVDLAGQYKREQFGPLDADIYRLEDIAAAPKNRWFKWLQRQGGKVTYAPDTGTPDRCAWARKILGPQLAEMDRLIAALGKMSTEQAEIFATVFAAWNDFLHGGSQPSDEQIIREVRENWHANKQKFSPEQLQRCIAWMHKEQFEPRGGGPRTTLPAA